MKKFLFSFVILFLLAACGTPAPADAPTLLQPSPAPENSEGIVESEPGAAEPVCIAPEPTQADIDRALNFTGNLFETPDWERSYTVSDDSVAVNWYSENLFSVVFLEALVFPCSYEDLDLDGFFNVDNWQIILGNYQSFQLETECRNDSGLRLYEFTAVDQGYEYAIRYWAISDTDTRVVTFMVVLPVESPDLMEEYAYALFPQLTSCE